MALVTFSNPDYKDKTVYAVAGSHTETLLKIAKENKIPVQFDCQDGECGHCLVRVTSVDDKDRMGYFLTDKEQTVLKELGKLTQEQIDQLHVDDMPSEWRLACQMIVRDEDVLVEY
ncbi:2Fe-2S iron-sulfur cluster-binding protein [Lamprobacter modestohalophilus]|uniref:Ferredoxin n=1 Tax=Lamprobacter modestohalophilus TaxID=1064514 RepID=A0A9X0W8A3_9GAMM|nr:MULTISPECIES: 2Fe-2S iron-sulfur cluster-binding protein [Chromatiaceae]MBK1618641.1 ferredoxin [Lamprobacter modestohalophilus]MBK5939028.1 ferredoxin [Halochromatium roseum]MEA1048308.1 2Fe-2S iron-sulfur cluster-binding protein [Lamprobacter modestohalophilus]